MKSHKMRFVGVLSALLLFGFITTCLVSYYVAHDSLASQIAETTLPLTSDNIYSEIQRDLLRPIFISSLMAQDTFVRDWALAGEHNEKAIIRYLEEIQRRYGTVTSFFVSEKTRRYYHPSGVLKQISQDDPQDRWYFRVRQMHDDYEINVDADTADLHSLTIFINYRVFDYNGNYIGATGVGLAVKAVRDMVNTYQHRYGRRVYFTDREGNITLRGIDYKGPENIRQMPGLASHATQLLTSPSTSLTYQQRGKTVYLNSRLVPEFGWYLLVEQVEDPAEARILKTLLGNLAVSLVITAIVLFLVNLTIGRYQRRLEEMATTDKLTGVANRHVFDMFFEQAVRYSKRRGGQLSAIMLDIDRFKEVNDSHGHPVGDLVLKALAQTVKEHIRESDMLFRWGGEEFLILLPDCDQEQAARVAEKIRHTVEDKREVAVAGQAIGVTASLGVAQLRSDDTAVSLIRRVDGALYLAKQNGRNRVEMVD